MRGRNELAGGKPVVPLAYACGIWVTKPITSWAEKIVIINNNPFNAPPTGNMKVSENINKLIESEQKQDEISTENCRQS